MQIHEIPLHTDRMVINNNIVRSVGENVAKLESSYSAGGNVNGAGISLDYLSHGLTFPNPPMHALL